MTEAKKPNVSRVILERLKTLDDLPRFPNALMKLEQILVGDQDVHLEDVSSLVAQDPRLTAGVIGVVNSARYSPGFEITSIDEAVNRLGTKDVRMMAHAINYKSAIKTKPPFSEKEFMKHAMLAAFVAQSIAKSVHFDQGEAFLCGLMHDIGVYLLATEDRDKYKKVMAETHNDIHRLVPMEHQVFGTTHTVMGARLLQQWRFPKEIIMAIASHHTPEKADPDFQNYTYLTYLAEMGAHLGGHSNGVVTIVDEGDAFTENLPESMLMALEYFGISYEHYYELVLDAVDAVSDSGLM